MMSAAVAGMMVIGVLFWAIELWFLSRPGVKAACANRRPMPAA